MPELSPPDRIRAGRVDLLRMRNNYAAKAAMEKLNELLNSE